MATGNNKRFFADPVAYIKTHQLLINPQAVGSQVLKAGKMNLDFVSIDPQNPAFIRMEDYDKRSHSKGAAPIAAYFLPAVVDDTSTLDIDIDFNRSYMFTADLSGCLFAAYGNDASRITVEHVNVRTANARVNIAARAQAIIAAGYGYYRILSPKAIPQSNPQYVKSYDATSSVVGIRTGAGWSFYYKPEMYEIAKL